MLLLFLLSFFLGYSPHPNYGMITQTDYTTGSNYGSYGSIAAYQSVGNSTLGGPITVGTTNSSIAASVNPYASSVIGSSNGYSNVLSISSGGIPVSSCYPIPSSQHLTADKNCTKERWVTEFHPCTHFERRMRIVDSKMRSSRDETGEKSKNRAEIHLKLHQQVYFTIRRLSLCMLISCVDVWSWGCSRVFDM